VKASLELGIAELDGADEAQQIEATLARLDVVGEVRTAVSSRTALVSYDPQRIRPETIREAITSLGMTVTEGRRGAPRRRGLADLLGCAFVSIMALVALVGERLGVVERLTARLRGCSSRRYSTVASFQIAGASRTRSPRGARQGDSAVEIEQQRSVVARRSRRRPS
jgi:copper chaperone CopZ